MKNNRISDIKFLEYAHRRLMNRIAFASSKGVIIPDQRGLDDYYGLFFLAISMKNNGKTYEETVSLIEQAGIVLHQITQQGIDNMSEAWKDFFKN